MRPFDIELAKKNHPVQTRDGRPVRIMYYDLISTSGCTIGALINNGTYEGWMTYLEDGKAFPVDGNTNLDLVIAPTKKEGWVNIYRSSTGGTYTEQERVYNSEEEAFVGKYSRCCNRVYITSKKIEWEE